MENSLPPIPAKRYFTIGEVADLCGVKPHVLRYWEQEFTQLRPMKRRGNRRYYQHHEVLMIRRIRDLLYDQGFTISGARNKMQELLNAGHGTLTDNDILPEGDALMDYMVASDSQFGDFTDSELAQDNPSAVDPWQLLRHELFEIRDLLATSDSKPAG
jgi:DNA-binding transcriptional MerR regulator